MRVSVFGLGYVGAVSCGCFANDGFSVIGVDVNPLKVQLMNQGQSPIVEERIGDLLSDAVRTGRLRATTDVADAVLNSDISVVSVGTPSNASGRISLDAVERVSEEIGHAIARKPDRHLVVVRSTVLPGSVRRVVVPALERASGKRSGQGFGVCFNPEFLREGSSVKDHYDPPYTLIGADDPRDGEEAASLYAKVDAPIHHVGIETAEMVKYACNAFHALKITFANEIGIVAQSCGVDSHAVMNLVCADTKLNISPKYLMPGFAFGGSCLPKDVRALLYRAREADVDLPMMQSMLPSNRYQIERAINLILGLKRRRIGILGISFKAGTDDLRESPLVLLTEALIGKGLDIRIYDSEVSLARLVGANKEYIEREIPHIASLLIDDLAAVVEHGDALVVGNASPAFHSLCTACRPQQIVIDLAGIPGLADCPHIDYRGITW
ncbi:MAG TPA: nucleotide sugar dehydrogenase [Vicinamibacterales bacterium]|nr:nucleotide sugar dehydrogenase [Vicinamibacterales bacterium]